jgi:hypothetical protein
VLYGCLHDQVMLAHNEYWYPARAGGLQNYDEGNEKKPFL